MFKNLFKRDIEVKKVEIPCTCDADNEHCDLILQLRKCQYLRKDIENEIKTLNNKNNELIFNFIGLLKTLETNGLRMDSYDKFITNHITYSNTIIERTINQYSSADIFRITEELKTYKNKADIICEKQRALKAVEDNISDIKSKLGIE